MDSDNRRMRNLASLLVGALVATLAVGAAVGGDGDRPAEKIESLRSASADKLKQAARAAREGDVDAALALVREVEADVDRATDDVFAADQSTRAEPAPKPPAPRGSGPKGHAKGRLPAGKQSTRAVIRALDWLAAHQSPNGMFEAAGFSQWCHGKPIADRSLRPDGVGKAIYDPGVTGLALHAFLAAGFEPGDGSRYADVLVRGLRYLRGIQDPEGCFGPRSNAQYIYSHGTCALAMVEAYAATRSPVLKGSVQRGLDFIELARNPYFAWRYGIKPGDNDTSISGWMTMALARARDVNDAARKRGEAPPLRVDPRAFDGMKAWLEKVTDPDFGRVGYVTRGTGPARPQELVDRFPGAKSEAMTAVAVLCRLAFGATPGRDRVLDMGASLCMKLPPRWNPADGSIDMYYWYYATQALARYGEPYWGAWKVATELALLAAQRRDGEVCTSLGSWDPIGPWGLDGGRVMSTALLAHVLAVCARN